MYVLECSRFAAACENLHLGVLLLVPWNGGVTGTYRALSQWPRWVVACPSFE